MTQHLLLCYQRQLVYACLDDFCGIGTLSSYEQGAFGSNSKVWCQAAIDFLYRNLVTGLIESNTVVPELPLLDPLALCNIYATTNPNDQFADCFPIWQIPYYIGTNKLSKLLQSCNAFGWEHFNDSLNIGLVDSLDVIYTDSNVKMTATPLIPIITSV